MALRSILKDDNPRLRKKSKIITEITPRLITLLDDMAETMYDAKGVGLAAPQVGVLKRVVVIDVGEGLVELINPEITEMSGTQVDEEGCLSLPERSGVVVRPEKLKVKALDREGKEIVLEAEGFFARAVCHETDHLEGVLFTDRVAAESMEELTEEDIERLKNGVFEEKN